MKTIPYQPKYNLKAVIIVLLIMMRYTNPAYDHIIADILTEMDNWGKLISVSKEK